MDQKKLIEKLNKAANMIHQKSLKGNANYITTNSTVADYINDLDKRKQKRKERKKKLERIFKCQD